MEYCASLMDRIYYFYGCGRLQVTTGTHSTRFSHIWPKITSWYSCSLCNLNWQSALNMNYLFRQLFLLVFYSSVLFCNLSFAEFSSCLDHVPTVNIWKYFVPFGVSALNVTQGDCWPLRIEFSWRVFVRSLSVLAGRSLGQSSSSSWDQYSSRPLCIFN